MNANSSRELPGTPEYVSADEYCKRAQLPISGRTLHRWCDDNPLLAGRIGELRVPGKRLYDARTAPFFRDFWMDS
jgi:hypothetical protein